MPSISSSSSSKLSASYFNSILEDLKNNDHKKSTKRTYYKVWQKFNEFVIRLDDIPDKWEDRLSLYLAYLINVCKLQSSTIKSYVSAIKSTLIKDGYDWNDKTLLLNSITKSCKSENDRVTNRFPIRKGLLQIILKKLADHFLEKGQPYLKIMYTALFSTAYFGLFRIGELTISEHVIKARDIHVSKSKTRVLIILYSSKTHGRDSRPQEVRLNKNKSKGLCPVSNMLDYTQIRPGYSDDNDPLFIFSDGTPVKAAQVQNVLRTILKALDLNPKNYDTHSFRIGRATDLSKMGQTVDTIKKCGRWRSNAVYEYLRYS